MTADEEIIIRNVKKEFKKLMVSGDITIVKIEGIKYFRNSSEYIFNSRRFKIRGKN